MGRSDSKGLHHIATILQYINYTSIKILIKKISAGCPRETPSLDSAGQHGAGAPERVAGGPFSLISTPDSLNEINDSVGRASIQRLQVQPHHVGLGSKLLRWPQQV